MARGDQKRFPRCSSGPRFSQDRRMPSRAPFLARWSPRIGRKAARLHLITGPADDDRALVLADLGDPVFDRSGLVPHLCIRGGRLRLRLPRLRGAVHAPHVQSSERTIRVQGLLAQRPALPLQGLRSVVPQPRAQPGHWKAARRSSPKRATGAACASAPRPPGAPRGRSRQVACRRSSDDIMVGRAGEAGRALVL